MLRYAHAACYVTGNLRDDHELLDMGSATKRSLYKQTEATLMRMRVRSRLGGIAVVDSVSTIDTLTIVGSSLARFCPTPSGIGTKGSISTCVA